MVEMVQKEESIERSEESVEESNNKDCEVIMLPNLDKDDSSKPVSDELPVKEKTVSQSVQGSQKTKIAIKLTGKTGIKPVQYPVLPPCISVGKMPGRGKGRHLKSGFVKKLSFKEIKKPLSLDDFLTSSNKGNIPVVSESGVEASTSSETAVSSIKKQILQNDKKTIDDDDDDDADVPVVVYGPDVEPKDMNTKSSLGLDRIPLPAGPPPLSSDSVSPKTSEQSKEENFLITTQPIPPPSSSYTVQQSLLTVDEEFNSSEFNEDGHMLGKNLEDKCPDQNNPPTLAPIIGAHYLPYSSTSSLVSKHPSAKSQGWTQEDLDDMKLLGIDPASQVPMAEIRPPPLPSMVHWQSNETEMKKRSENSAKDDQNTNTLNKNCSTSDFSAEDKAESGEEVSLEKAKTSSFSSVLSQPKISAEENDENSHFSTENQESVENIKPDVNISLLKTGEVSPSKSQEEKVNISTKTEPQSEAITKTLSKSPDIVIEAESIPVKKKCQPDDKVIESKEKKQNSISIAKSVSTNATLSGIGDVSSLNLQPTISLVPLPASFDMALSSNWEVPPPSRSDVLTRESEHNYALRFMENSDQVKSHRNPTQLHNDEEEEDDDDDASDWTDGHLKAKQTILKNKSSDINKSNSSSDSDSEGSSASHDQSRCLDSDNSTSPPVLSQEQEQFNRSSNNSPPSLSAESPCHVALSCPSTMMPVTLICSSKCDNSALFTTAEPLCIDSEPMLDDSMSILNFDSVVRNRTTKSTPRRRTAKKQAAGNKSSNRGSKKAAAAMKKKCSLEEKADSPTPKSNQADIKLLAGNKLEQEKIIVKVTSHTSEGVPVISLTAASVGNSSVSSTLPVSTSSSTSMFPTTMETEIGDTSLVEAAAKKAETLPKMFMPTVVLHDIKYTMGRDLSQMTAIPASIENIPIFESENESDSDVKSDLPKKSADNSQRSLEIESPSKSSEAFDPYMFLNRPTKSSVPSTSSSTNHSCSITTSSSSHLVGESSSFTSLAAGGTCSTGQVEADSLPSLDHGSMVSNMFDVADSKYAFPEVFLENGEPETSMKLSTIDVLGPELPFETSGKSSVSLGLDLLTDFYPNTANEESG